METTPKRIIHSAILVLQIMDLWRIVNERLTILCLTSVYIIHVRADLNKTFVSGQNAVLQCEGMASALDTYIWAEDIFPSEIRIYIAMRTFLKTDDARRIKKYDNFFINSSYPESVDMIIQSINLDDKGSYKCELVIQSRTVTAYNVRIEVPPQSVAITCVDYSMCPTSSDDTALSEFYCTCEAIAAYPNTLTIQWNGATGSLTNFSRSLFGQNETFDFSSHAVFRPHFIKSAISCHLTGFHNDIDSSLTSALYTVSPPSCTLQAATTENCSMVTLTCSCNEAIPDVKSYTFYNEHRSLIGYSINSNVFEDVHIRQGEYETFYCRGCNGLFFGESSLAKVTFMCTVDTTTSEGTTMSGLTTESTTDSGLTTEATTDSGPTTEATTDSDFSTESRATSPELFSEKSTFSDRITERITVSDHTTERTALFDHTTERTTFLDFATTRHDGTPSLSPQEEKTCRTFVWLLVCSIEGVIIAVLFAKMVFGTKTRRDTQSRPLVEEIELPAINEDISRPINPSEIHQEEMNDLHFFSSGGCMKYHIADYNGTLVMKKLLSENSPQYLHNVFTEEVKSVMKLSSNENVVEVLGWCNTEPASLIQEFVEGRSLQQYVRDGADGTNEFLNAHRMAFQVACGLEFLHRNKFIHPGLRAKKVVVNQFKTCKLFAFLSEQRVQELRWILWEQEEPYQWMSPEYHQWEESTSNDDVWSFGVLFWELISRGAEPYETLDKPEVLSCLHNKRFLERPGNCPNQTWQIITDCWKSAQRRLEMENVVESLQALNPCEEVSSTYEQIEE